MHTLSPDRTREPSVETVESVSLIHPEHFTLSNGIPVYAMPGGRQEVVRTEILFTAGTSCQQKALVASSCNNLMQEGTEKHDANALAEELDFYGAYLENDCNTDHASQTVYSLSKHFNPALSLLSEIIAAPIFPDEEFDIYVHNAHQSFLTRNRKVSEIASAEFHRMLFGGDNFYGYRLSENDYHVLSNEDVRSFYNRIIKQQLPTVVVSGRPPAGWEKTLDQLLGQLPIPGSSVQAQALVFPEAKPERKTVEKPDALQCALRVGRRLFNKTHPDYLPLSIVNTILGGYFGSRLMKNIREDKGYTYGIGSGLVSRKQGGFFYISSEVGADVAQDALKEIYHELRVLATEPVSAEELELVKNYLLGQFLRGADGVFSQTERFLAVHLYGLDYSYYDRYLQVIQRITPEEIMALAAKYLMPESMSELVVGKTSA